MEDLHDLISHFNDIKTDYEALENKLKELDEKMKTFSHEADDWLKSPDSESNPSSLIQIQAFSDKVEEFRQHLHL